MFEHIHHRLTLLLLSGLGLTACAHLQNDPYFAGFHADDPARGVTPSIVDRGLLITAPLPSVEARAEVAPEQRTDPYRDDAFAQYNLMVHLYGPYYNQGYRSRLWLQHQRRWNRIPWYAYDPLFDDHWMFDPYWGSRYRGGSRWYDPWYAGFYDPWFWDPYGGGYGLGYSGFGGYYYYGSSGYRRHGALTTVAVKPANKQRRLRSRRDLPTTMSGGPTSAPESWATETRSGWTTRSSTPRRSSSVSSRSGSSSTSRGRSSGSQQSRTRKRKD